MHEPDISDNSHFLEKKKVKVIIKFLILPFICKNPMRAVLICWNF